jgi:hypothetical protein
MLPDNRVRALASGIVTVAVVLLAWALKAAVCACRTYSLESGIPEGVYVALGGQAWKYQVNILPLIVLLICGRAAIFCSSINENLEFQIIVKVCGICSWHPVHAYLLLQLPDTIQKGGNRQRHFIQIDCTMLVMPIRLAMVESNVKQDNSPTQIK